MAAEFNVNILPFNQSGTFSCSQYDVGRTATITLLDEEGEYTIPTGATVTINATKPSGFGFSEECSWSGSTVTIETTATMTEEAGKFPAELRITSGDTVLVSANFLFRVEESAHPENVVDGDAETAQALTIRVTALESAVADLQSAVDDLSDSMDSITVSTDQIENGAVIWEKLSSNLKARISSNKGISGQAVDLLITILESALYTSNQSANITLLEEALLSGNSDVIYQSGETLTIDALAIDPYQSGEVLTIE